MRKNIPIKILCLLLAGAVLLLPSCSRRGASAEELLYKICADAELPAGKTYLCSAAEGDAAYLSPDTAETLFGADSVKEIFPLIEDYAIYISTAIPQEIAVFRAYSRSDTDALAAMCLSRIDTLSVLLNGTSLAADSEIIKRGKYVIMLFGNDTKELCESAENAIK